MRQGTEQKGVYVAEEKSAGKRMRKRDGDIDRDIDMYIIEIIYIIITHVCIHLARGCSIISYVIRCKDPPPPSSFSYTFHTEDKTPPSQGVRSYLNIPQYNG